MEWVELLVVALLWVLAVWGLYRYGSFEMTGARGWRRVWAGFRLLLDQTELRLHRWAAQARRRR